jgi:TRAP-type mannitol/chloroaromatic compound transport system permease large subunit
MVVIIFTQIVVLIMGCFMGPNSILLIVLPIFMPVVSHLHFDTVWFGVMTLINVQLGLISPPFGMDCYVMKGVCPYPVGLGEVFKVAMPFFFIGVFVTLLIMIWPQIALWLPSLISR